MKPPIRIHQKSSEAQKIYVARMANLTAAITCNHKKGIDPKNPASKKAIERYESSLLKKQETIEKLKRDMEARTWKTEIQKNRLEQRLEKLEMQLRLQKNTRDYNLGTSLRNYIDPRVMKAWMAYVGLDWKKIYTSTLQRKFKWVEEYRLRELRAFYPSAKEMQDRAVEVVQEESELGRCLVHLIYRMVVPQLFHKNYFNMPNIRRTKTYLACGIIFSLVLSLWAMKKEMCIHICKPSLIGIL